ILARAPLHDGDVDARQGELARQHQPRRTRSDDHHRMFGHRCHPRWLRAALLREERGLEASPCCSICIKGRGTVSFTPFPPPPLLFPPRSCVFPPSSDPAAPPEFTTR